MSRSAFAKTKPFEEKDIKSPPYPNTLNLGVSILTSTNLKQSMMQNVLRQGLEISMVSNL